ncbi:MAG: serine/threonine-protein kinase [Planctomycetota bacterium]|nr:serine/threonine-protein kinase [Planctomycetota bacterium]
MTQAPPTCPRCGSRLASAPGSPAACLRCAAQVALDQEDTNPAPPPRPPLDVASIAAAFPAYELGAELGRGATGAVFRAKHRALGREFALKIIAEDVAARPGFAERFEREARTLGGLAHPGIVAVHDAGRAGPWFFLAMELVDGVDLRQMLVAKRVAPREALAIVAQMCDALQYAHDQGVVHRDIKPENVLVDRAGRVRILDFGLARVVRESASTPNLTRSDQVMGTPLYMAPEQWRTPLEVDHRADIYSLGVVFYELLTGELPVGRFPPPSHRVELDVRLDEVVFKTLEREPERRYQHISELKTDLGTATRSAPAIAPPPLPANGAAPTAPAPRAATRTPRQAGSNRILVLAVGLVIALNILLLVLYFLWTRGLPF